jgi:hypothetical protein
VIAGLRRFLDARPATAALERCELCGAPVAADHGHLVAVETRALLCACRACWLLFRSEGAAGERYRAVPCDVRRLPGAVVSDSQWDAVQVPVGLAFFFVNSALGRAVAFYPSPAGATECALPADAWSELLAGDAGLRTLRADVEAVLVDRRTVPGACYVVPIDACYTLVGLVRRHWKGFDGGEEARRAIAGFFDDLERRSGHGAGSWPS